MTVAAPGSDEDYCYLTTTGRRTGRPHRIEIWFATADAGRTLYLMAGGGDASDWVRNLRAEPRCTISVGTPDAPPIAGTARVLEAADDPDAETARDLLVAKYEPRTGDDLTGWRRRALPVAVDLDRAVTS